MNSFSFEALLIRPEGVGTWTFFNVPPEVSTTFGAKGQVKVMGTINNYPFRSTAMPQGDGTHYVVVAKAIREQIHAVHGDTVQVTLELDPGERNVSIPKILADGLENQPQAKINFEKMAYSHQKAYVDWILSAKKEETAQNRVSKALEMIAQGKKLR